MALTYYVEECTRAKFHGLNRGLHSQNRRAHSPGKISYIFFFYVNKTVPGTVVCEHELKHVLLAQVNTNETL